MQLLEAKNNSTLDPCNLFMVTVITLSNETQLPWRRRSTIVIIQRGQLYTSNDLSSDTEASLVPVSLYVTHQTCRGGGRERERDTLKESTERGSEHSPDLSVL